MDVVHEHRDHIVRLALDHDLADQVTTAMPYAMTVIGRGHDGAPSGQTIVLRQSRSALEAAGQVAGLIINEEWLQQYTPLWRGPIQFAVTVRATQNSRVLYCAGTSMLGCTAGSVFLPADPAEAPIVSLTHVSRPQVSLFDSTLALQAMQALRDLPMVVGGAW